MTECMADDQELGEPVQLTYGLLARFVKRMVPILRDMATVRPNSFRTRVRADDSFSMSTGTMSTSMRSGERCPSWRTCGRS